MRIRIRGYGYADTDTRIRICGYGYEDTDMRDTDVQMRISRYADMREIYIYMYDMRALFYCGILPWLNLGGEGGSGDLT